MKPNDHKDYAEYCIKHELRPTLSTYPIMYFIDMNGNTIKKSMESIYRELGWKLNIRTNRYSKPASKGNGGNKK